MAHRLAVAIATLFLLACGSAPPRSPLKLGITKEPFSAPLGQDLIVNTGEHIFVEGEVVKVPTLSMSVGIESTMPGAYGVPFSFSIQRTDLELSYERGPEEFYCAPHDQRTASFPGLGSVVARADCVGVMKNQNSGELRWVVDNSSHNGTTSVWSRPVKEADQVQLTGTSKTRTDDATRLETIYFEGFHSGLLHFAYHSFEGASERIREFKFDYPPREGTAIYGVRGKTFEVIDVDNTKMRYRWVSIAD